MRSPDTREHWTDSNMLKKEQLTQDEQKIFLEMVNALGYFHIVHTLVTHGSLTLGQIAERSGLTQPGVMREIRNIARQTKFIQKDQPNQDYRKIEEPKYDIDPQKRYLGEAVTGAAQILDRAQLSQQDLYAALYPLRQPPFQKDDPLHPSTPIGILLAWEDPQQTMSATDLATTVNKQFPSIKKSTAQVTLGGMIADDNLSIFTHDDSQTQIRRDRRPLKLTPLGELVITEVFPFFIRKARSVARGLS